MSRSAAPVLALDQGTTSTRAALLRPPELTTLAIARRDLPQHFPAPGWVEHDPEEIWQGTVAALREVLDRTGIEARAIAGLGITNQRETVMIWERASGRPIHRAIVWQDRRTEPLCRSLRNQGCEPDISARTGLLLDPYFSATKLAWLLDTIPGARARAERGELAAGTVDTFLLWRLTGGRVHATDATNASRTLLFDIRRGVWDPELLDLFRIPAALLAEVRDCGAAFGTTEAALLGAPVPILGISGDQQAAAIGQCCFSAGMAKATFGTGAFVLLNTGATPVASRQRLLTTIAWQHRGTRVYALEGSIFVAGAAVQWLRDGLGLLGASDEAGPLAAAADPAQSVVLVPAFTGLGAPYWDAEARGALFGLTRATGPAELARAALECVGFQTHDLIAAMHREAGPSPTTVLRADGGLSASNWAMQFLADILASPVDRPRQPETTVLGAAYLAGRAAGVCPEPDDFATLWQAERRFEPVMAEPERAHRLAAWHDAVRRTRSGA